jgi:ATP-binding cassette subfamily B protein
MSKPSPLFRLLRYARQRRGRIWTATSYSLLNKAFDLAPPFLIGAALDVVVRREGSFLAGFGVTGLDAQLYVIAALTIFIWSAESLFEYLLSVCWRGLAQDLQHELRLDAYAHMQRLELAYFEQRPTGDLMAVLNDDINQLERFLDVGANDLIQVAFTTLAIAVTFFLMAPEVAWLAMLPIPVVIWGSFHWQRLLAPRYADVRERAGLLNGQLANNLGGIATIKSFVNEDGETRRIAGLSESYREGNRKAIRPSSAFTPLIRFAILFGFLATLLRGGGLVLDGVLEAGLFATMTFLTQRLLWPLTRLGQTFDLYQRAMASTRRVLDLLDTEPQITGGERILSRDAIAGEVRLESIDFAYVEGHDVLHDLTMTMPAGQTTAIVGATGSGKSTVAKLLLRFYDPRQGRVLLDGQDLRELDMGSLRRGIGFVSQDVFLFHGTVRENIAYGHPEASEEEIQAAASAAEAHEFVLGLPAGYDTIVGERGQRLSGGQRQRISIARAILDDPPVLVLDEATSAVDNETEAAIQRSLEMLEQGRTTIVIAHRLSTIRNADHVYVLDAGRVAEEGAHEELLARRGIYAGLWDVQTGAAMRRA